jgi:hypothetical protein
MTNENRPPVPSGREDDVPRNQKGQPLWPRPPRKPLTGWVLLLPALLLVGAIWITTRAQTGEVVPPVAQNSAQPPVDHAVPRGNTGGKKPGLTQAGSSRVALYFINDQAELDRREVPLDDLIHTPLKGPPSQNFEVVGTAALQRVFKENAGYFPDDIKVESLKKEGDLVTLDLPANFATSTVWSKGDSFPMLATDSIVNTLAAVAGDGKLAPIKVRFLSGGKPFELLGEIDMTEPLHPIESRVAAP